MTTPSHPASALDDTVHQRVRLGILAVLSEARRADFSYVRDALELTAGNLSRHLRVLEDAGLLQIDKTFEDRRSRTWIAITKAGRAALRDEIRALRAIIDQVDGEVGQ